MSGSDSPTFFHGQPWSNWIERIGRDKPLSDEESEAKPTSTVTRLSAEDIDLYGFCPERDTFYGVVCEICNAIVKPQALIQHMESRHPSGAGNFPTPSLPTTKPTVKTPYCKVSKLKKTQSASTQNSSSTKVIHTSIKRTSTTETQQQQQQQLQQPSNTSSTSLPVSSSPRSPLETTLQTVQTATTSTGSGSIASSSPVKSPGNSGQTRRKRLKTDRSLLKDREYDPDRHCGVLNEETGKPCTRSLTCKAHTVSLRRTVIGRSKTFDKLLAEHRAAKEVPTSTRTTKLSVTGTVVSLSSPSVNALSLTTIASTTNIDSEAPSSPPVLSLPDTYPLPKAVDLLYRCLAPHGSTKPTKLEEEFGNEELRSLESSLVEASASTSNSQTTTQSSTGSIIMGPLSTVLPSFTELSTNEEEDVTMAPLIQASSSAPTTASTSTSASTSAVAVAAVAAASVLPTTSLTSMMVSAMAVTSNDVPSPTASGTPTTTQTSIVTPTPSTTPNATMTSTTTPPHNTSAITASLVDAENSLDVDPDDPIGSIYSAAFKDDKTLSSLRSNNLLLSPLSRSSYHRQLQQASSIPTMNLFESVDQLEQRNTAPINGKRLHHANHTSPLLGPRPSKRSKQDYQHGQDYSTSIQLEATTTSTPYPNFGDITWSNCHPEPLAVTRWLRITSSRKQYNFNIH
ncbi:hypothetical protein HZH66_014126 [Vespula vulgaris]|uniref:SCA7 domain-containing protein n=2 Tax=Vespula vulgaris TaxID=7454 RepID=A0A834MQ88_VESVU|nr:ataxin-7-like protein 1 isoform X1 [Vespula vulgaris]KAF7380750.1 hypothetical protein HZH66_014126 [Vespula vulgaris]